MSPSCLVLRRTLGEGGGTLLERAYLPQGATTLTLCSLFLPGPELLCHATPGWRCGEFRKTLFSEGETPLSKAARYPHPQVAPRQAEFETPFWFTSVGLTPACGLAGAESSRDSSPHRAMPPKLLAALILSPLGFALPPSLAVDAAITSVLQSERTQKREIDSELSRDAD